MALETSLTEDYVFIGGSTCSHDLDDSLVGEGVISAHLFDSSLKMKCEYIINDADGQMVNQIRRIPDKDIICVSGNCGIRILEFKLFSFIVKRTISDLHSGIYPISGIAFFKNFFFITAEGDEFVNRIKFVLAKKSD